MTVVDEIKDQLDIIEVISGYLSIKKAGRNYKALCPFHSEKTPSFVISPERQIWHCFGCGKGGDIFGFVKEIEGVEFKEALRILADKAGIELKREDPKLVNERVKLAEINEKATEFFHYFLSQDLGQKAFDYLKKRKVNPKTIEQFKIGYAPDNFNALLDFLTKRRYTEQEILKAGLLTQNEQGKIYDKFRGRLIFPIRNPEGKTIAFGGRILKENNKAPKYLNSPQTPTYDKSRTVYNLDQAKTEARKKDQLIIVEGYMDVLAVWQKGNQNVIATSGTALTPGQLTIIKRYTPNILLAFDSDSAGSEATKRGIETAIEKGLNVKIINLGKYKDPDEMIQENPKQWEKAIKDAMPIMDFYFESAFQKIKKITPQAQKQVSYAILPLIAKLKSPIDQDHYLKKLSNKLNLEPKILHAEMQNFLREQAKSGKIQGSLRQADKLNKNRVQITLEEYLVAIILLDPKLQAVILKDLKSSDLTETFPKKLYSLIQEKSKKKVQINFSDIEKNLEQSERTKLNLILIKIEEENKKLTAPLGEAEITTQIQNLRNHTLVKKLKVLQKKIQEAEAKKDTDTIKDLTKKITELSQKLSSIQNEG